MDKKYTDKFIPLKDDEVSALSKLTNKSTFEELKKVDEMRKVLDTIKEIYKLKISLKSLRYLKIVSTVRKFQLNAFKDLLEIKKLLAKNIKEKLKTKRGGRAMKGKAPKDTTDKIIAESKKEDPLGRLMKDILKSKSSSDLEKAIKDYANIFCQSGVQNLIKSNALGKVFTDMFTVIKQNVNNAIFEGKIGFDNSGWNASKEFMNILTTGLACLTQLKPVFDFFKNLFKRAFRIVTTPFRRGDRPPNGAGRGDGPDDDDGPPQPPSTFDRQQRNVLNELFRKQQQSIESGIIGASGGGSQQPPPTTGGSAQQPPPSGSAGGSGFSFSDYFSNLFSSQSPPTGSPPTGDDRAGDPTNDAGAGAIALVPPRGGRRTIIPEPFAPNIPVGYPIPPLEPLPDIPFGPRRNNIGAGIPSGRPEDEPWDPFNIAAGAAFLAGASRFFTNPAPPQEPPLGEGSGGEQLPRDDGLGFEDEFQREEFEMEEAERARREAEEEDEQADLKAIMPPPSSVEVAGSLFGGSKVIPASSYDAVRAAQLASKIFNQMAGAVNQVDTIDESVELKDALTNQQVIEFDIQNQIINQMTQSKDTSSLREELTLAEDLVQEGLLTMEGVESGQISTEDANEFLNDILKIIDDILTEIPKEEAQSEEVSRLKTLRATILNSVQSIRDAQDKVEEEFDKEYEQLLKGYERALTLGSLQDETMPNIRDRVQVQNVRNQVLSNIGQRARQNMAQQETNIADRVQVQNVRSEVLRNIGQRARRPRAPLVVSPTLQGLPFPLRPQTQGGALIPSREPSLETLPTVAERVAVPRPRQQGVGRPRDILTRITGVPSNRETLTMVRLRVNRLAQDFGFDGPAFFREFLSRGGVLNRAGTKLNANGRKLLGNLLSDTASDLGIPIDRFFSGI